MKPTRLEVIADIVGIVCFITALAMIWSTAEAKFMTMPSIEIYQPDCED